MIVVVSSTEQSRDFSEQAGTRANEPAKCDSIMSGLRKSIKAAGFRIVGLCSESLLSLKPPHSVVSQGAAVRDGPGAKAFLSQAEIDAFVGREIEWGRGCSSSMILLGAAIDRYGERMDQFGITMLAMSGVSIRRQFAKALRRLAEL